MNPILWSSRQQVYNQTTDGTNDYYVGINGTNGFSITPLSGLSSLTFSILIDFPSTINSSTAGQRLFEIANSDRSSLFGIDIGGFTAGIANEYLGVFTNISAVLRASAVADGGSIATGLHHIAVSVSPSAVVICIDGVSQTITNNGTGKPVTASTGYTANKISLMASTAGSVPTGTTTWREALLLNVALNATQMDDLHNYYLRDHNVTLDNTDRTAWRYYGTSTGRGQMAALYSGRESGTDLIDRKAGNSLTKTNF